MHKSAENAAKSEKRQSRGNGYLREVAPWGRGPRGPWVKIFFVDPPQKLLFPRKNKFYGMENIFCGENIFENFVQENCFSSWEDCQELDTPDLGLCLPRVVTETQLQTKNRRVCVLCEGALASEAQK